MQDVDLALCLAVDVSASVDYDEYGLMMGGLAAACRDAAIIAAATAGPRGATALALLQWSGPKAQAVAVPWLRLDGAEGAERIAAAIDAAPRLPPPGTTALGEGLVAALALLGQFAGDATRLVVDLSGDGAGNTGRPSRPVRDLGVEAGVTINGLAVLNEEPDLLAHYEAEVIGGPNCFAMTCATYADFRDAIARKMLREVRGGFSV